MNTPEDFLKGRNIKERMLCFFGIHDWKYFSNGSDNGKFCKRCKKYRLDNIDQTQINELR